MKTISTSMPIYVGNDPVSAVDPGGKCTLDFGDDPTCGAGAGFDTDEDRRAKNFHKTMFSQRIGINTCSISGIDLLPSTKGGINSKPFLLGGFEPFQLNSNGLPPGVQIIGIPPSDPNTIIDPVVITGEIVGKILDKHGAGFAPFEKGEFNRELCDPTNLLALISVEISDGNQFFNPPFPGSNQYRPGRVFRYQANRFVDRPGNLSVNTQFMDVIVDENNFVKTAFPVNPFTRQLDPLP